jgi:hypothetical protein
LCQLHLLANQNTFRIAHFHPRHGPAAELGFGAMSGVERKEKKKKKERKGEGIYTFLRGHLI